MKSELENLSSKIPEIRLSNLSQSKDNLDLLERSVDLLKKSEMKYREIMENMVEGYFEVDLKGKPLGRHIDEIFLNSSHNKQTYDILIVDDDQSTILLLKDYFESFGISFKGTRTGTRCLEELER